jgi:DNA-binding GntR family transcriptional regulator
MKATLDLPDRTSTAARKALRHEVAQRLLSEIFRGELGAGNRLMVARLADRFGTSSTPVREALLELEALGVIEFVHNRGAIVAPFGAKELREIYDLRRILETEAARSACGRLDRGALETLRKRTDDLADDCTGTERIELALWADLQLHELISAECGNFRLAKEIQRYGTLVQTVREIIGNDSQVQQKAMKEHVGILGALLSEDPAAAAAAMSRHIDGAARSAEDALFPQEGLREG